MLVKYHKLFVICLSIFVIVFLFSTVHNNWQQPRIRSFIGLVTFGPQEKHSDSPPAFVMKDPLYCPIRNISIMKKTDNFTRVGLLSYPGSGNTWTRHLIQQLTGFCTGTVYCDAFLSGHGFPGECVFPNNKSKGCIVYKSHYNEAKHLKQFDKAVILIRNPFEALKAYFNFKFGIKSNSSSGKSITSKAKQPHMDRFHAIVDSYRYNSTEWNTYVKQESFHWQSLYIVWLKTFANRFLLVRYLDLKEDLITTLQRISNFLHVPIAEADYTCTYANREGQHHRKQKFDLEIPDIFSEEHINMINGAIMNVMNATRNRYRLKDYIFVNMKEKNKDNSKTVF